MRVATTVALLTAPKIISLVLQTTAITFIHPVDMLL